MERLYLVMSVILSMMSGFVNVAMVITFAKTIAHHTGSLTRSVVEFFEGDWHQALIPLLLVSVFMFGGVLSGVLFPYRDAVNRYGKMLITLGIGYVMLSLWHLHIEWLLWYSVFMLGIQNGFCLPYRGLVVRTTHFTGYMTDAGVEFGRLLVGKSTGAWKIAFFLSGIMSFLLGAIVSGLVTQRAGEHIFIIIGLMYSVVGISYMTYVQKHQTDLLQDVCQKCGKPHD